jgi:hypothetical protein
MFRITYADDNVLGGCVTMKTEETNDIKDLKDIVIGLDDRAFVENKVENIAAWMNWGDKFISKGYTIEFYKG